MAQDGHWEGQGWLHKEAEGKTAVARDQPLTGREGGSVESVVPPSPMTHEGKEQRGALLREGLRGLDLPH